MSRKNKLALQISAITFTTLTSLAMTVMPAAAATRTVAGNYCGDNWQAVIKATANAGTEGCLLRYQNGSNWVKVIPASADIAKDGYSSKAYIVVQQNHNGSWATTKTWTLINSAGKATSLVGEVFQISRAAGATALKLTVTSCSYNAPTAKNISCGTNTRTLTW